MIYFINEKTGRIESGTWGDSAETLEGITFLTDGCVAVYLDDTEYPEVNENPGQYLIENGVPVYSPLPPSTPATPEPTLEERTRALEDAMTVVMGL